MFLLQGAGLEAGKKKSNSYQQGLNLHGALTFLLYFVVSNFSYTYKYTVRAYYSFPPFSCNLLFALHKVWWAKKEKSFNSKSPWNCHRIGYNCAFTSAET